MQKNNINPAVKKMTSFIVMDILERAAELQAKGCDIIHLEVGEPDFEVTDAVKQAATESLSNNQTHYTHSLGDIELRKAISQFYKKEYAVNVSAEQILVTSGSSPAILMALQTLCEAGSEVLISNPGYPCYRNFILACNAVPVEFNLNAKNGFQFDIDEIKSKITDKTRAIFVNSPMNPTGTLVSDNVYKELAKLNIPIISDEIYHGLVYNGNTKSVLNFTENAFVVNGFSKRYAMTGLRLGYIIAPEEYMRHLQTLQQNLFICAPSIAQKTGIAALTEESEKEVDRRRAIYDSRRKYMLERLQKMGLKVECEPMGAFYVFCNAKKFTSDSYKFAFDILEKAHVGITPGIDFGSNGEGYVRLSYANSMKNIKEGLDRLENYLKEIS